MANFLLCDDEAVDFGVCDGPASTDYIAALKLALGFDLVTCST